MLDWLGAPGDELIRAFTQVFGASNRPFGKRSAQAGGLSDGVEGVQWNAGYDRRSRELWVGVNLEGMRYTGWPVARLIRRELMQPTLPALGRSIAAAASIDVAWRRDFWQYTARLTIEESAIAPTPIPQSRLTDADWVLALTEAEACLNIRKDRVGRAHQEVTLASGGRKSGHVSPHLTIRRTTRERKGWPEFFRDSKRHLQPLHDWAVSRAV